MKDGYQIADTDNEKDALIEQLKLERDAAYLKMAQYEYKIRALKEDVKVLEKVILTMTLDSLQS